MNFYAWAHGMNPDETIRQAARIPRLGLILYPRNYDAAPDLAEQPIAYVNSVTQADAVAANPALWRFAILGDERNITGLSGKRETPDEYMRRLAPAERVLRDADVETSAAGLGMVNGRFDREYAHAVTFADHRGVNYAPTQYRAMRRGIDSMPDRAWFPTIIPVRANWLPWRYNTVLAWLWQSVYQPSVARQIETLARAPNVLGVGIWCLREVGLGDGTPQSWHGLIDARDRLTWQGRLVKRLLA